MEYGFLTLVAPIVTLAVAIATRKVPLAMLIGIFIGQLIGVVPCKCSRKIPKNLLN